MDSEDFMISFVVGLGTALILILLGFMIGKELYCRNFEVQDIKQIDSGYYITIDNKIYYKGANKDE